MERVSSSPSPARAIAQGQSFGGGSRLATEAEDKDADQTVPDIDDMASRARQVIRELAVCSTLQELDGCLARWVSSNDIGSIGPAMETFTQGLQRARGLVNALEPFEGR